jgi:hypothetical protein
VAGSYVAWRAMRDRLRPSLAAGRWPLDEDLAFFGLSQQEADTFYDLFTPIAERLGLAYTWRRNGDDVTMTFTAED